MRRLVRREERNLYSGPAHKDNAEDLSTDVPLPGGFDLYVEALIPELQYEAAGERAVGEFGTGSSAD